MATLGPLFPFQEPIAAETTLLVTPRWRAWLRDLRQEVGLTARAIPTSPVVGSSTSVPTTPIDGGTLGAGLYAISWYLAVVTAAGVSSSAQVTISWIDHGVAKSYIGAVMNGNTSTTVQVSERLLIYSDGASPISYALAYTSVPAGAMVYTFRPVLQAVATG